jgi:hypothetical protein
MGIGSSVHKDAGKSTRDPREGKYTIGMLVVREGETACIYSSSGEQQIVHGPSALRPKFGEVQFLDRVACDQQKYLVVEYLNGKVEHRRGPTFEIVDPCVHKSVTVRDAIMLEASQAVVVYAEDSGEGRGGQRNVSRRLVKGPEIFIPMANEWLHRFSWHGSVIQGTKKGSITGSPNDTKVAHAVEFTKLRQLPDQMYYTVRDLRTSDDALLTLHIMIFFELVDIEKMLDSTNDPISDMVNAANADVMTFGASRTYEGLLADSNGLSDNASYPLLISRMQSIGYVLNKVVYRGYQASSQLQKMQETAISSRTKLRLEADTFRHEQANAEYQLNAQEQRSKKQFAQEEREAEHKSKLSRHRAEQELAQKRENNALVLAHERDMNKERKDFLMSLVDMGVDLTKYLCAEVSSKPTSHLLIENAGDNRSANLHIH